MDQVDEDIIEEQEPFYDPGDIPQTDRTKEIAFVNKIKPFRYQVDQEGNIIHLKGGDAPAEALIEYYGLNSPRVSLSNIKSQKDEEELDALMNIIQMDVRATHPRDWYDLVRCSQEDQTSLNFKLGVTMGRDNQERQNTITTAHKQENRQGFTSRAKQFFSNLGKMEG